jgi:hypothetical protein
LFDAGCGSFGNNILNNYLFGRSIRRVVSKTLNYSSKEIQAVCEEFYPGVDFERRITLIDKTLCDRFVVRSEENHNYDYFFHFESAVELKLNGEFELAELGFSKSGYEHLHKVQKLVNKQDLYTYSFWLDNNEFEAYVDLKDKELFVLESFDNPVNKMRKTLIIRHKGKNAEFILQFRLL